MRASPPAAPEIASSRISSGFFFHGPQISPTSGILSNGELRLAPYWSPPAMPLDQLIFEVITAAGGAGSVHRVVIYTDLPSFYPGQLFYDSGPIATDTIALKTIALASGFVLPSPWSWVGAVQQGNPTPGATIRQFGNPSGYVLAANSSGFALGGVGTAYSMGGVTASPPAVFPPAVGTVQNSVGVIARVA